MSDESQINPRSFWWDDAYCHNMPLELFFGSDDYPMTNASSQEGRMVCHMCDVQRDCLIDALNERERYGMRGGYLGHERKHALDMYKTVKAAIEAFDEGNFYIRNVNYEQP